MKTTKAIATKELLLEGKLIGMWIDELGFCVVVEDRGNGVFDMKTKTGEFYRITRPS